MWRDLEQDTEEAEGSAAAGMAQTNRRLWDASHGTDRESRNKWGRLKTPCKEFYTDGPPMAANHAPPLRVVYRFLTVTCGKREQQSTCHQCA